MYEEENLGLTPAALKNLFVEKKESEVTKMEVSPNTVEPREIVIPWKPRKQSVLMRRQWLHHTYVYCFSNTGKYCYG